jgi:EmrB/QacA subfamily drug resistance transporter
MPDRDVTTIVLVSIGSSISALDLSLMFVAYPSIRADFPDAPVGLTAWVLTSFTIVAAALLVPAGRLADRVGRKRVFLTSLLIFASGSLCCAVAPTIPVLIAARVIAAVGGAMLTPSALALVLGSVGPERRSFAIGLWSTVTGTMTTAGPTIGAGAISLGSWRWVFLIIVPIALGVWFVGRRVLTESIDPDAGPFPDLVGAAAIMAAVATFAFAIVQSSTWGWADPRMAACLAGTVVLIAAAWWRCAHHPRPVIDLRIFRPVAFRANALAALAIGVAFFGSYYLFIEFLTKGWGYTVLATGLLLVPMTLASSCTGVFVGRMMDRHGPRVLMVPGALLMAAALGWMALRAGSERDLWTTWLPVSVAVGLANATYFTGVNSAGARTAPPEVLALTAGVVQTLVRVGGATGSALGVAFVEGFDAGDPPTQLRPAFVTFAVVGCVAALAAWPLSGRTVRRALPSVPAAPRGAEPST